MTKLAKQEITHLQKLRGPNEGGNANLPGDATGPARELWLLLHAPIVGTDEKPKLCRLPSIIVDSTTFAAYQRAADKQKDLGEDKSNPIMQPTHCQKINYWRRDKRLWFIYSAPPVIKSGVKMGQTRHRSRVLALISEEELLTNETVIAKKYCRLVQTATLSKLLRVEEASSIPGELELVTQLPQVRVSASEYDSWLIYDDLYSENNGIFE